MGKLLEFFMYINVPVIRGDVFKCTCDENVETDIVYYLPFSLVFDSRRSAREDNL